MTDRDGNPNTNKSYVDYHIYCESDGPGSIAADHQMYFATSARGLEFDKVEYVQESSPNAYIEVGSGTIEVSHNNDGTGSITFDVSIDASSEYGGGGYGLESTFQGTFTLETIPRYATITSFTVSKRDETSVTYNYSTNAAISAAWYSTNNGSTWYSMPSNKVITGLAANTNYNFKLKVRRADSGLDTVSNTVSQQTYDYPYCISTPNFTIGSALTLKFYNPLKRSILITIVGVNNSTKSGGTTTGTELTGFNSNEWKNWFYATIPSAKTGTYKVTVTYGASIRTRNNGNTYTINTTECLPTFSNFTYRDTNTAVTNVTENDQIAVKRLSSILVTVPVANKMVTKNSATGTSYIATLNNIGYSGTYSSNADVSWNIGSPTESGTKRLTVTAKDSRDLTTSVYKDITILDYEYPIINIEATRRNNFEAQTTVKISGKFSRIILNNQDKNTIQSVKYRYRVYNGSYNEYVPITPTITDNTFTCEDVTLSLTNTNMYDIEVEVIDSFNQVMHKSVRVDKGKALFHINIAKNALFMNDKKILSEADIKHGTFTPYLSCTDTSKAPTVIYRNNSDQYGEYWKTPLKNGKSLVFITIWMRGWITSVVSDGYACIRGLPFANDGYYMSPAENAFNFSSFFRGIDTTHPMPVAFIDNNKAIRIQNASPAARGGVVEFWVTNYQTDYAFEISGSGWYVTTE